MTQVPTAPIHVRAAREADIDAIEPLVRQFHARIGSEAAIDNVLTVLKRYVEGQGCVSVAEPGAIPCGYACASFQMRTDAGGEVMNVIELFVDEPWRNRGVARKLLQCLVSVAESRGVKRVVAEVHEGNAAIERVLEAAGFEPERRTIWSRDSGPAE